MFEMFEKLTGEMDTWRKEIREERQAWSEELNQWRKERKRERKAWREERRKSCGRKKIRL